MNTSLVRHGIAGLALFGLAGCAAVAPGDSRAAVRQLVAERSGATRPIEDADDDRSSARVRTLLVDGLTVEDAVEITFLRNHELRAVYTDLDIAESDLVQAGLLHNPVLDAAAGIPIGGGVVDLSFGVAMDLIDVIYVPLRQRVASARLEEAKLRIAAEVLELAWRSQTTAYRHQANEQMLEVRRQVAEASGASAELARRMRGAGNITELELASEAALADEAKLEVRLAEVAVRESREELNSLMGLWGSDAGWTIQSSRLADPPDDELDIERLETRAIERSLDLAAAERFVVAAGENVGLDRASALFPEVVAGGAAERDGGEWDAGPTLSLPIPLFDWGQARTARARAELRRARELHHALAVRIRAETRMARDRLLGHRDRAVHYRAVHLPLRERVVAETQLHYNAMQVSPLDLLRAKEAQIETAARYVEALRDYWTARADLGLILAGRIPPREPGIAPPELEQLPRLPFPTL
ncbi:MAG: TolC family protein [Candidatus Binatia bacterium]